MASVCSESSQLCKTELVEIRDWHGSVGCLAQRRYVCVCLVNEQNKSFVSRFDDSVRFVSGVLNFGIGGH